MQFGIARKIVKCSSKYHRSFSAALSSSEVIGSCNDHTLWTWSAQKAVKPIHMTKAEGIYFWDGDGKRFTDLNSQLMCTNVGHQHPKMIQAIKDQADKLCYAGPMFATDVRAEVGSMITKRTPGTLNKVFFTLGGSEANENAIKFARLYTGRNKIITRFKAYHGATHGAAMLTGDPRRWPHEASGMGGIIRVFDPYKYRSLLYRDGMSDEEFSALMVAQLEETILYENPDNIACMILETVTGTNGLIPPPAGYLQGVRRVLSKYGILMICDEVMCGVGRTGWWFACQQWDVVPDIITMAKGVTSGYMPLGVVAVSDEISAHFDHKPFGGGLTYSGHPLCLAAASANLKIVEEENLVENSKNMGLVMAEHLYRMKERHPCVGDVRCVGLFGCLELVKSRKTKEPMATYNYSDPSMGQLAAFLRSKGIFQFSHWNVLHFIPPLVITKEQLDETFEIIDEALSITDAACVAD